MNLFSPNNLLMTIVLVLLTILLAIIVIPFLIVVAVCCLFSYAVMGISSLLFFNSRRDRDSDSVYEATRRQDQPRNDARADSGDDDAIECEVISVRTVEKEENTSEGR